MAGRQRSVLLSARAEASQGHVRVDPPGAAVAGDIVCHPLLVTRPVTPSSFSRAPFALRQPSATLRASWEHRPSIFASARYFRRDRRALTPSLTSPPARTAPAARRPTCHIGTRPRPLPSSHSLLPVSAAYRIRPPSSRPHMLPVEQNPARGDTTPCARPLLF
ncbi:hypothetical protein AcV7_002885 [Taiwanofungus camphoratus]|nr:hypothetical protein AcV7_002885 [Antrodia cinnamomea]